MVRFTLKISKQVLTSIRIASTVRRTFVYNIHIYIYIYYAYLFHIIYIYMCFAEYFCDRCGQSTVATGDAAVELTIIISRFRKYIFFFL